MRHAFRRHVWATLVGCVAVPSALFAALPATATDARLEERIIERLAPKDRQGYVQRLVARQRAEAPAGPDIDVTGPVLTGFNASATLNLDKPAPTFKVAVKATDDLSGVTSLTFYAFGPRGLSGQQVAVMTAPGYPMKGLSAAAGIANPNRMLEPGSWKFAWGYGYDAAGNYAYFDEAALEALGNTTFTVVNSGGHDSVAPTLVSGDLLTPSLSLSAVVPGTTVKLPYAKIKVGAADTGNSTLAGVRQVIATFCKVDAPALCLNAGSATYVTGRAKATLYVGTELTAGTATGSYELMKVLVYDHADNVSDYVGTAFGGTTDFSLFFPGGATIKVKP